MFIDRGNGYYQTELGKFDAALVYDSPNELVEVARTDGDAVIGWDKQHTQAITEWANDYGLDLIWRVS